MTVFTLFVLVAMLLVGGMAIDFIRFKSEQTLVQDTADRAVIAATMLDNSVGAEDVVDSYFKASGLEHRLLGSTVRGDGVVFQEVTVNTRTNVPTFILPIAGINSLDANSTTRAMQGIGDIEISLVLDVSWSMMAKDSSKINDLRTAALAFAQEALKPEHDGQISLNVIPYAGGVNIGPELFNYLNSTSYIDHQKIPGVTYDDTVIEANDPATTDDDELYPVVSHCLNLVDSDYKSSGLPGTGRMQTPHFLGRNDASLLDAGWWCVPRSQVKYGQRFVGDPDVAGTLGHYLSNLQVGIGTSTHDGIQYGLALLDPTSRNAFAHLNGHGLVDDAFKNRPLDYQAPGVQKILIVMTDGAVWHTRLPKDPLNPLNLTQSLLDGTKNGAQPDSAVNYVNDKSVNFKTFSGICTLAKGPDLDIRVFTIAFETSADEGEVMRKCATSDSHYYATSGSNLTTVFSEIAEQISALRLTQ